MRNIYTGVYRRVDGSVVSGAGISDLVAAKDASIDMEVKERIDATIAAMNVMRSRAEAIEAYDQMIASGNEAGNAVVQAAIDGLVNQTKSIERAVGILGLTAISIEGSDSLDDPDAVFH
jgi:putative iron-regulated protein